MKWYKEVTVALALLGFAALIGGCGLFGGNDDAPQSGKFSPRSDAPSGKAALTGRLDFNLDFVVPDSGPLRGGQDVRLHGQFPVADAILTASEAYAAYAVYFGLNRAEFDATVSPVVTASRMYVVTPPGDRPGFVDVRVVNLFNGANIAFRESGYEYVGLKITDVTPDIGPLAGGQDVRLDGIFSIQTMYNAYNFYVVFFGDNIADFNRTVPEVMTEDFIHVITPPGDAPGRVDVRIEAVDDSFDNDTFGDDGQDDDGDGETDGYTYGEFFVTRVIPDSGPLAGGNDVVLEGGFPIQADINTLAEAEAAYTIYFGNNIAPFDGTRPPDPIITSTHMYAFAPPGDAVGFVDVRVDALPRPGPSALLVDGYEYLAGGIGQWTDCELSFRPVGRIDAGELQVTIVVTGTVGAGGAFIVPQGGDPSNSSHRILLQEESRQSVGGSEQWVGTNADPIDTIVFDADGSGNISFGDLFADGHAAVYVLDDNGEIIGDDFNPPFSDGDRIVEPALTDRHFIIDTIPPRMLAGINGVTAADLVTLLTPGSFTAGDVVRVGNSHPFPLPSTWRQNFSNAPSDDGLITINPGSTRGAQIFFNVESISNNWNFSQSLDFQTQIVFVDRSLHDVFNLNFSSNDDDLFAPSVSNRQVAGFADPEPTPPVTALRDMQTSPDHIVQWVFQPDSSPMPNVSVNTQYQTQATTDSGFSGLGSTFTQLLATWDFVDPGIDPNTVPSTFHMNLKFRGADLAARTNPPPDGTVEYTAFEDRLDPLHAWWLRSVQTDVRASTGPGAETTNPGLNWQQISAPELQPTIAPSGIPFRVFSYRTFATAPGQPKDASKDGPFLPVTSWAPWSATRALSDGEFFSPIPVPQRSDRWYLFVVVGMDEAGNVEQWPVADLLLNADESVAVQSPDPQGTNWVRFFVPTPPEIVETTIVPTFWHEISSPTPQLPTADPGEANFGSANVVPLAPLGGPAQLFGSFRINLETSIGLDLDNAFVEWELLKEGNSFGVARVDPIAVGGDTALVILPLAIGEPLGNADRSPAHYTFRAATVVIDADGLERRDSTPANFQFVVVDNVADFIEGRESEDVQPILESDRP